MTAHGLIIGNCHAAALRLAWRQHSTDWPDLSLDFVAAQGDGISDLSVDDLTLSSSTDAVRANLTDLNGQDSVDLSPYDFIALCGGTPSSYHAVHLYQTARWPGLPSVAADPSPLTLLSTLCFEHALAGVIGQAPVFPLLRSLAATQRRLIVIPHPLLSFDVIRAGPRFLGFANLHRRGDAMALAQMLDRASLRACADLASLMILPDSVRQDGFFTRPIYRRGATRLGASDDQPQPRNDCLHGNVDYGRQILSALARMI